MTVVLQCATLDLAHGQSQGWDHPVLVTGDDHTVMAAPRWSPDGRRAAASRAGAVTDRATSLSWWNWNRPRRRLWPHRREGGTLLLPGHPTGASVSLRPTVSGGPVFLHGSKSTAMDRRRARSDCRRPPAAHAAQTFFSPDGQSVLFVGYTTEGFRRLQPSVATTGRVPVEQPYAAATAESGVMPGEHSEPQPGVAYRPWPWLLPGA